MVDEARDFEQISRWFAERGFVLHFSHDAGAVVWADLVGLSSGKVVAPSYGRGETEIGAARSAQRRYTEEQ